MNASMWRAALLAAFRRQRDLTAEVFAAAWRLVPSQIARERGAVRQARREERDRAIVEFAARTARLSEQSDNLKWLPGRVVDRFPWAKWEDTIPKGKTRLSEATVRNILKGVAGRVRGDP